MKIKLLTILLLATTSLFGQSLDELLSNPSNWNDWSRMEKEIFLETLEISEDANNDSLSFTNGDTGVKEYRHGFVVDTTWVSGLESNDLIFVNPSKEDSSTAFLCAEVKDGHFMVGRSHTTTKKLKYQWLMLKRTSE